MPSFLKSKKGHTLKQAANMDLLKNVYINVCLLRAKHFRLLVQKYCFHLTKAQSMMLSINFPNHSSWIVEEIQKDRLKDIDRFFQVFSQKIEKNDVFKININQKFYFFE